MSDDPWGGSHVTGREPSAWDPAIGWWIFGWTLWVLVSFLVAATSNWNALGTAAVALVGPLLGTIVRPPRRMTLQGQILISRTPWRRSTFDLGLTRRVTGGGPSYATPGELWINFNDGSTNSFLLVTKRQRSLAKEVVKAIDAVGKADTVPPSVRKLL
ncbi:hypothetical protein [Terrabacter aerolatus]|nr:hypothetical protein [Terrabacter aerolatus]